MLFFIGAFFSAKSQKSDQWNKQEVAKPEKNEPKATVTFKTKSTVSPLLAQLLQLTKGDEVLTEQVIALIPDNKKPYVQRLVDDAEYEKLNPNDKLYSIRKSEIMDIINKIRN